LCVLDWAELASRVTSRDRRNATVILHVTPCDLVDIHSRFDGAFYFLLLVINSACCHSVWNVCWSVPVISTNVNSKQYLSLSTLKMEAVGFSVTLTAVCQTRRRRNYVQRLAVLLSVCNVLRKLPVTGVSPKGTAVAVACFKTPLPVTFVAVSCQRSKC